jgi:hypothetical protein
VSLADIEKGARWATDIAVQFEECRVGLICLTPENLSSPWLLFEAGALSKTLDKTFVCPYLLNLQPTDVQPPLSQFQATTAKKEETRKLLQTINKALEDRALQPAQVNAAFEKWWPDLEKCLNSVPMPQKPQARKRTDRDKLREVPEIVRTLAKTPLASPPGIGGRVVSDTPTGVAVFPNQTFRDFLGGSLQSAVPTNVASPTTIDAFQKMLEANMRGAKIAAAPTKIPEVVKPSQADTKGGRKCGRGQRKS